MALEGVILLSKGEISDGDEQRPNCSHIHKSSGPIAASHWTSLTLNSVSDVPFRNVIDLNNHRAEPRDRLTVNVCGRKFELPLSMLAKRPQTLLGNPDHRHLFYDKSSNAYFFNCCSTSFKAIVHYYQCGALIRPSNVTLERFLQEILFFELEPGVVMQLLVVEGFGDLLEPPQRIPTNRVLRWIWLTMEQPQSSLVAKIFSYFCICIALLSIITYCIEPLPELPNDHFLTNGEQLSIVGYFNEEIRHPYFIPEWLCMVWFTAELVTRFIVSPGKRTFLKSASIQIDLLTVLFFYVKLAAVFVLIMNGTEIRSHGGYFLMQRILRMAGIVRMFKLARYSSDLRVLGRAITISLREIWLMVVLLGVGVVLFSISICLAEPGNAEFATLPEGFWWAIVTMTTVGDVAPETALGRFVGGVCAVGGLIMVALPIPVMVDNFNLLYQQEQKRPVIAKFLEVAGEFYKRSEN